MEEELRTLSLLDSAATLDFVKAKEKAPTINLMQERMKFAARKCKIDTPKLQINQILQNSEEKVADVGSVKTALGKEFSEEEVSKMKPAQQISPKNDVNLLMDILKETEERAIKKGSSREELEEKIAATEGKVSESKERHSIVDGKPVKTVIIPNVAPNASSYTTTDEISAQLKQNQEDQTLLELSLKFDSPQVLDPEETNSTGQTVNHFQVLIQTLIQQNQEFKRHQTDALQRETMIKVEMTKHQENINKQLSEILTSLTNIQSLPCSSVAGPTHNKLSFAKRKTKSLTKKRKTQPWQISPKPPKQSAPSDRVFNRRSKDLKKRKNNTKRTSNIISRVRETEFREQKRERQRPWRIKRQSKSKAHKQKGKSGKSQKSSTRANNALSIPSHKFHFKEELFFKEPQLITIDLSKVCKEKDLPMKTADPNLPMKTADEYIAECSNIRTLPVLDCRLPFEM